MPKILSRRPLLWCFLLRPLVAEVWYSASRCDLSWWAQRRTDLALDLVRFFQGATHLKRDKADNLSSVIPRETRNLLSGLRDSSFLSEWQAGELSRLKSMAFQGVSCRATAGSVSRTENQSGRSESTAQLLWRLCGWDGEIEFYWF